MDQVIQNIINHHFPVADGQEAVIICDSTKSELARRMVAILNGQGVNAELVDVTGRQDFLKDFRYRRDIGVAVLASHAMWGSLRDHLGFVEGKPTLTIDCCPVFFDFVMPLDSLLRVYGSDCDNDRAYLSQLQRTLPMGEVRLTTPGGTCLTFTARDWQVDPWTEIHTSPVESSVNGRIVADASVFFAKVSHPIELSIENGVIRAINYPDHSDAIFRQYLEQMKNVLTEAAANWQVAEVGLGGNAHAIISGCIMEDEMARDTCHICFGDNTRYGGANYSSWHGGTVVMRQPRIEVVRRWTDGR